MGLIIPMATEKYEVMGFSVNVNLGKLTFFKKEKMR